ncbi:MAG: GDP-mannose 4,6-dehydratase [Candidatus Latescibacteria bacterium]|jgi:GDPmannose 4,6-dehydratase|nr:GDP-mannose 4,6-dehydratase [Candidatus Latescibacterota bacterium]
MSDKKCAVITGVTGQDGSYLAELLLQKGYHVVGLSRRSTHHQPQNIAHLTGKIDIEYSDLIDPHSIERVIAKYRPEEVYNLAAQSVPADSWSQPVVTGEITALGPVRIMEAIRLLSPETRFYQATTREIYGGVDAEVIDESTELRANNPYGAAKLYAHLMVDTYRQSYDQYACSGILFNHESPRRSLHFVTRKVTMAVACIKCGVNDPPMNEAGQPLVHDGKVQMGDLDMIRDWGFAKEYVIAMWAMLQQDKPRDYVIATNTAYSIRDLCETAFSHAGLDWKDHVVTDDRFLRPTEIAASRGDYSRARSELNWSPVATFDDLIHMMVDADISRVQDRRPNPVAL